MPRTLAVATIWGRHLFCSEVPITLRLFAGGDYLMKYGMMCAVRNVMRIIDWQQYTENEICVELQGMTFVYIYYIFLPTHPISFAHFCCQWTSWLACVCHVFRYLERFAIILSLSPKLTSPQHLIFPQALKVFPIFRNSFTSVHQRLKWERSGNEAADLTWHQELRVIVQPVARTAIWASPTNLISFN